MDICTIYANDEVCVGIHVFCLNRMQAVSQHHAHFNGQSCCIVASSVHLHYYKPYEDSKILPQIT